MPKTGESGSAGERWLLLYEYFRKNTCKGHVLTQKEVLSYLDNEYDIKISTNTFYNDVTRLSEYPFNLHIEFDYSLKGYYASSSTFEPYELSLIIDSIQASKFITQRKADELTRKMKDMANRFTAPKLERQALVMNRTKSMNESVVKDCDKIYEAINGDVKISFKYFHRTVSRLKPKEYINEGKPLVVSPYTMLWDNGTLYLYAYSSDIKREPFRRFRIDRMDNLKIVAEKREGKDLYKQKNVIEKDAKIFNAYGGEAHEITFRCYKGIVDQILDTFGDDKIMMIPDKDNEDYFKFTAKIEVSPTFYGWLFTFGRKIKIVNAAPEVINRYKEYLNRLVDFYKDE